jgi:hypothetical protein
MVGPYFIFKYECIEPLLVDLITYFHPASMIAYRTLFHLASLLIVQFERLTSCHKMSNLKLTLDTAVCRGLSLICTAFRVSSVT